MPHSSKRLAISTAPRGWKSLPASTQMFLVALIIQIFALVVFVFAFVGTTATLSGSLSLFLTAVVVSIIASALVMILCLVGLFRFRKMTVWNALLLFFSLVTNPVVVLGIMAAAL